jgi:hypothetical protein
MRSNAHLTSPRILPLSDPVVSVVIAASALVPNGFAGSELTTTLSACTPPLSVELLVTEVPLPSRTT